MRNSLSEADLVIVYSTTTRQALSIRFLISNQDPQLEEGSPGTADSNASNQ
jgi:hypothetical protein